MVIFKKAKDLSDYLLKIREKGGAAGFVPTMGALHRGHISLLSEARKSSDTVVVSIFVNPTQFDDKDDYEKYPVTLDKDLLQLASAGCDVVFIPSVEEIYPEGVGEAKTYEFGRLEEVLEGEYRKDHFKGVGQVVARLLQIVQPDNLYLGQKDYQQCMIITSLVEQMGHQLATRIEICPTIREADGLAMSSRNQRLTPPQRALAPLLYQCLVSIKAKKGLQPFSLVQKECLDILKEKGFEPDYVALTDAGDLTLLDDYKEGRNMVALIAARIGKVRLIDNMLL